jgi:hypothetical protein
MQDSKMKEKINYQVLNKNYSMENMNEES